MVSKELSSWTGFVYSHLIRFSKLKNKFDDEGQPATKNAAEQVVVKKSSIVSRWAIGSYEPPHRRATAASEAATSEAKALAKKKSSEMKSSDQKDALPPSPDDTKGIQAKEDIVLHQKKGQPEHEILSWKRKKASKLLAHAKRGVIEAEELLRTGKITFPLRSTPLTEIKRLKVGCMYRIIVDG